MNDPKFVIADELVKRVRLTIPSSTLQVAERIINSLHDNGYEIREVTTDLGDEN